MNATNTIVRVSRELQRLERKPRPLPGDVAEIAITLMQVLSDSDFMRDDAVVSLVDRYRRFVGERGMGDIVADRMKYARRIADCSAKILYEEMHLIFFLCDTIHALKTLGFSVDARTERDFVESIKSLFRRHAHLAAGAAKQSLEPWNEDLWWYRTALGQGGQADNGTGS